MCHTSLEDTDLSNKGTDPGAYGEPFDKGIKRYYARLLGSQILATGKGVPGDIEFNRLIDERHQDRVKSASNLCGR